MSDDDNVIHVNFGAAAPEPEPEQQAGLSTNPRARFEEMVDRGTVLVTFDARPDLVTVPRQFKEEFRLSLNFCYGFGIPDFAFDDDGVRASLSFGGVDQWCDIPWRFVYMMRGHAESDVFIFPDNFPPEMLELIPELEELLGSEEE